MCALGDRIIGDEREVPQARAIEAWRVFRTNVAWPAPVNVDAVRLFSVHMDTPITRDVPNHAVCLRWSGGNEAHHAAPHGFCDCGWWAFNTESRASQYAHENAFNPTQIVVAKVKLWGRILSYQGGYRAEFMEVVRVREYPSRFFPDAD